MSRPDSQRVVVTGIGLVTPVGNDTPTTWSSLLAGRSGIGPITAFDTADFKVKIAGEVKDFDPTRYVDKQTARRMDRVLHFAVAACQEALADACFRMEQWDPRRVGVIVGSGIGGVHSIIDSQITLMERGPRRVSPFAVPASC